MAIPRHVGPGQRHSAELVSEQAADRVDVEVVIEFQLIQLREVLQRQPR